MKILFLVYHGLSDVSGISKKILAQVDGLKSAGNDVHLCLYTPTPDGRRVWMVNGCVIKDYGKGALAKLKSKIDLQCIADYCKSESIEFVYARSFHNANPFTISLFRSLREMGIRSVIEIPTYPYDHEYKNHSLLWKCSLQIDKIYRHKLAQMTDAIVTFTDDKEIFGQRTIRISNGIDFNKITLRKEPNNGEVLNVIGVAEVHYWHGFDRFVKGLGEYYKNGGKRNVVFHIVGDVGTEIMEGNENAEGLRPLIEKYDIKDHVAFHGALFGDKLDEAFNNASFAVASLARHRSGITHIKTLKNREYAARGFSFVYSEMDSDFDDKPYVLKVSADETAVDIERVIEFAARQQLSPSDIRASISNLSWEEQMKSVINQL